jgi:hypothetical protein
MSTVSDGIMGERVELANNAEPILTFERSVRSDGGRNTSYSQNIPLEIVRWLDIDDSDSVEIHAYQNGYVVRPVDEGDE